MYLILSLFLAMTVFNHHDMGGSVCRLKGSLGRRCLFKPS
jgi:hypothetical protein